MEPFLTPEQRRDFRLTHRAERNKRIADRIKAILALDAGWSFTEVAEILCLDDESVRRFHRTFLDEGLEGLARDAYKGGVTKMTVLEEKALVAHLVETTYTSTKEIVAYVLVEFDCEFTIGGMRHLLRRLGFSYIKPKTVPGKADKKKQENFVAFYEELKKLLGNGDKIYFADACHPTHNAVADYGWMLKGQAKELKTNSGRHRVNLNGAIDPVSLDVVVRQEKCMNSAAAIGLFSALEARNPDAPNIFVILDNASYYKSKDLDAWLATSRVILIYLPPYSPNLNLAERLWKYFRRKVMANIYRATFAEFRHACSEFFRTIRHRHDELRTLMSERFETFQFS